MKITKRQAYYLAILWACIAGALIGWAASWPYGVATVAALASIACAVQFDPDT
jgi:hypothetical protein